ncbi:hypothetical protein [Lacinutrix chionoecetis]
MGAKELKDKIQEYLDKADERVLKIVNGVLENFYNDEIVAYHADGTSMSKKEYLSFLEYSQNQYLNKDFTSVEDLEGMVF